MNSQPHFSPQISHGSQHPVLRPFPVPVLPPNSAQQHPPAWVPAKLLSHFNWTWVGLVGSDNGNFEWLDGRLQMELRHTGSCVAFSRKISSQGDSISIMARIIASSPAATVVICDCYHYHFRLLVGVLWENNVTRRT